MLSDSINLTKGLIIFSAIVADYEDFDFSNDALAGIRANYFNSGCKAQSDKATITLNSQTYNMSYNIQADMPLSWKISKDNRPYQSVKKENGGIYCVLFYAENGIIFKRQFYNSKHDWLYTEYYNQKIEGDLLCKISPVDLSGMVALQIEHFNNNGTISVEHLFPSTKRKADGCEALLYTNSGMLWYDKDFCPVDYNEELQDKHKVGCGFNFKPEYFTVQAKTPYDLKNARYLEYTDEELLNVKSNKEINAQAQGPDNTKYSAYDTIKNILTEAHKSNKNLFGEIITQTADGFEESKAQLDSDDESVDLGSKQVLNEELIATAEQQAKIKTEIEDKLTAKTEEIQESSEEVQEVLSNNEKNQLESGAEVLVDDAAEPMYEAAQPQKADLAISNRSGVYHYFGELNEKSLRTGKGRTVTPEGLTSYEGEYKDDLRSGFGVCYYRNGEINYVGQWDNNNRSGAGVGYRQSDGTMHVGKWHENTPESLGARFDKDGNFIDVCQYEQGAKNGKGISFDENGNVVITIWQNGEVLRRKVIELGDEYEV